MAVAVAVVSVAVAGGCGWPECVEVTAWAARAGERGMTGSAGAGSGVVMGLRVKVRTSGMIWSKMARVSSGCFCGVQY